MRIRSIISIALLALVVGAGCSDDTNEFEPTDEDLQWPEYTFTSELTPTVSSVPAQDAWNDEASFPIEVTGEDTGDESILYSLSLAHHHLLKNQQDDGNYQYEYNALTGERPDTNSGLQQTAIAWSSVLLYRFIQREAILAAAYRAAQLHAIPNTQTLEDGTEIASIGGRLNSTAFAFFLLVELESTLETGEFTSDLELMGNYFENQVQEDGCIATALNQADCAAGHNAFAVGQAMVAIERLWRRTGDEKWLDILELSANYYYELYDGQINTFRVGEDGQPASFFWTAWAGPPIVSLLLERPDDRLEEWIFGQADYLLSNQYVPGDPNEYVGGFGKRFGGIPRWNAASEVEGIVDAYRLAEARGDEERMRKYKAAGILAARFMMSLQYRADNVGQWDLAEPEIAIGAYRDANDDAASQNISMHYVRGDYMDHMAVTMLKIITYLDLPEEYPGPGYADYNEGME